MGILMLRRMILKTKKQFIIDDYYELLNLHKALHEAKFCEKPNDFYISASPIIASVYKKLTEVLIECDVERKGENERARWSDWLKMDPDRIEWGIALERAKNESNWDEWTIEEKEKYIVDLFCPFEINNKYIFEFIKSVEINYPNDATGEALRNIQEHGSNMSEPMLIDFFISIPNKEMGDLLSNKVNKIGFQTELLAMTKSLKNGHVFAQNT